MTNHEHFLDSAALCHFVVSYTATSTSNLIPFILGTAVPASAQVKSTLQTGKSLLRGERSK